MTNKIDTEESRKKIGFVKKLSDWNRQPAIFDDHTLKIDGHPVMEDWEDGYMKKLADITTFKGGDVLELGYGMGISTRYIQNNKSVKSHHVVECHPDVVIKCINDFREEINESKMHVLSGFWQDITPKLKDGSFDGILFDTYPLTEEEIHSNHFWFFEEAYRLLRKGGVLTYYSDEVKQISSNHMLKLKTAGFHEINFEVCKVNPPKDCLYWQDDTIVAPIIIK
ncbi:MAG: guanidinoacetate N-methyltransferase [Patescibacteria group bacterium]|jgi:guanidinoacetate N-methyltransferase|nr:guanidinoacetate N-methyltransferase [Patescibacteria group bacterium]